MEAPPKIQLPPKIVRQQITGNTERPIAVAKIPLASARPMPLESKGIPPVGTISKQRAAASLTSPAPAIPTPLPQPAAPALPSAPPLPAARPTQPALNTAVPPQQPAATQTATPLAAPPSAPLAPNQKLESPAPVAPAARPPDPPRPAPTTTAQPAASTHASPAQQPGRPPLPPITPPPTQPDMLARPAPGNLQNQTDSLPVLSAFQQFLDNEREIMRRRIVFLSISYLAALILIVTVTVSGGLFLVKRLRGDFQNLRQELANLERLSIKNRTDADVLSERIAKETAEIRTSLIPASDDIKNRIIDKVSKHDDKLGKMDLLVQLLQKENSDLKRNLTTMENRWLTATNELAVILERLEKMQQPLASSRPAETPPAASSSTSLNLTLTPRGQKQAIDLQLPIPE